MRHFNLSLSLFFLALAMSHTSCKKSEPEPPEEVQREIDSDFNLDNSVWYFQQVSGEGVVLGSERVGVDNNPQGFAQFNADGTGNYSFDINFEIENNPQAWEYEKTDIPIEWRRLSEEQVLVVEIEQWERDTFYWDLITANENVVRASWDIRVAESFATITAVLTPEP